MNHPVMLCECLCQIQDVCFFPSRLHSSFPCLPFPFPFSLLFFLFCFSFFFKIIMARSLGPFSSRVHGVLPSSLPTLPTSRRVLPLKGQSSVWEPQSSSRWVPLQHLALLASAAFTSLVLCLSSSLLHPAPEGGGGPQGYILGPLRLA